MSNQQDKQLLDKVQNLRAHLVMIRAMKESQVQEEFQKLIDNALRQLGDLSPYIAQFYLSYGSFLLRKLQNSLDMFNPDIVPNAQDQGFIDEYDECYDQDFQSEENGANNEQIQKKQKMGMESKKDQKVNEQNAQNNEIDKKQSVEKVIYEDDNVQITQEVNEKKMQKITQKEDQQNNEQKPEQQQQQVGDIELCYEYLQLATVIYQKELKKIQTGEHSPLQRTSIIKQLFKAHGRLGQLYVLDQKYDQAISQFKTVVQITDGFQNPEARRLSSQAHYNIGGALLQQNNQGCQNLAIQSYAMSIIQLLKYIQQTQNYDTSKFEIPSVKNPRIDRFKYLPGPFDNQLVVELKDIMSAILDRIQDTHDQIQIKPAYQAQKMKMNQFKQESGFKQVPKDVKVTNLGTFGNRKRNPNPNQNSNNQSNSISSLNKQMSMNLKQHMNKTPNKQTEPQESNNPESGNKIQQKAEQKTENQSQKKESNANKQIENN